MSFVRAYSKHEASYIFRIKDLDLIGVAKSFGLLRLPRMPELKDVDKTGWEDASLDVRPFDFRLIGVGAMLTRDTSGTTTLMPTRHKKLNVESPSPNPGSRKRRSKAVPRSASGTCHGANRWQTRSKRRSGS